MTLQQRIDHAMANEGGMYGVLLRDSNCFGTALYLLGAAPEDSFIGGGRNKIYWRILRDLKKIEGPQDKSVILFEDEDHNAPWYYKMLSVPYRQPLHMGFVLEGNKGYDLIHRMGHNWKIERMPLDEFLSKGDYSNSTNIRISYFARRQHLTEKKHNK